MLERGVLEVPPATVEMRAAALLMSGQQGGDLDLATRWLLSPKPAGEAETDDGLREVRVVVEVSGAAVLEAGAALEIFVYAVGPSLDVRDAVTLRIDEPARYESQLLDAGVRAVASLRLEPGSSQELRVLARAGDRFGLRRQPLDVPDPGAAVAPEVPELADGSGRWLVAWPRERPPADAAELAVVQPQALPVLVVGQNLPVAEEPGAAAAEAILRPAGSFGEVALVESAGSLGLPPDVTPGVWELIVRRHAAAEATEKLIESRPLTVWVARPSSSESQAPPWPALARRGEARDFAALAPADDRRSSVELPEDLMRHLDQVLDGYFQALALRAAGDTAGAAALLADLEFEAIDQLGDGGLELLLEQEARGYQLLARRLGEVAPLLGVIRLHLEVSEVHRERGRFRLAGLAVGTARRFAEAYAEAADDDGRDDVASVLCSLAGVLQVRGPLADAVGFYRQALEYQPDRAVALFGLGSVLARIGEAEEAAEVFGRLLDIDPDQHEARLRRAVMLQRSGDLAAATSEYRWLSASQADDWIVSLARQQLVRLDIDSGRLDRAAERVDSSLERWPDQAPFHVARARLADLRGDRAAALEVLLELDPAESRTPAAPGPGGRTRFHDAPPPDLAQLRGELAALEDSRRGRLAAALDEILRRRDLEPVAAARPTGGAR